MIRFLNVTRYNRPGFGIKGITFTIEQGDFVLLAGANGAGKTTILRLIYQEIFPDSGQVVVEDRFLSGMNARELAKFRRKIGIVFSEFRLLPDRTIFENIALPLRIAGELPRKTRLEVNRLLYRFDLMDRGTALPGELSSGEQKKACLARALTTQPFILLADEPLSNIDEEATKEIVDHLRQINAEGMTILAATHITQPFEGITRRTLNLRSGKLIS